MRAVNLLFAEGPAAGGSPESVALLAEALRARGHTVTQVGGSPWTGSERGWSGPGWWWKGAWSLLGRGADLIHAHDRRYAIPALLAARIARVPAVLTLRDVGGFCPIATCFLWEGSERPADCSQWRLWRRCAPWFGRAYGAPKGFRRRLAIRYALLRIEQRAVARFDRVIYPSFGLAYQYRGVLPGAWPSPTVIPSPVRPVPRHACQQTQERPLVLFVGKPSIGKGFRDFEDAAVGVLRDRDITQVRFAHVGATPPWPHNGWIDHLGPLPRKGVEEQLCRADIVVVPSRIPDALPRVALEAMAHGRFLVVSDRGGLPECVKPGVTGFVVPAGQPKALAEAIGNALADPERRRIGGEGARRLAQERFSPEGVAEAHERLYERLLA